MIDFEKLAVFSLSKGKHNSAAEGVCAMEAVAWLEGLEHTDAPACTCPVIATAVRVMNDKLSDMDRQRLVAYLPRLVGTVSGLKVERERAAIFAQTAGEIFAARVRETGLTKLAANFADAYQRQDWLVAASIALNIALASRVTQVICAANSAGNALSTIAHSNFSDATYYAVVVIDALFQDALFSTLDIALAHGPQSPLRFSQPLDARVADYAQLVGARV